MLQTCFRLHPANKTSQSYYNSLIINLNEHFRKIINISEKFLNEKNILI